MSIYCSTNAFICRSSSKSFFLKCFIRMYRGGNRINGNVGVKNRLKLFSQENRDIDKLNIDERALDDLETELTSGKHVVDLHRRNIANLKKKIDLKTIERKYFEKIKIPNFLTWSEKEHIKELHAKDPDFWTYDKLSESFPATPDIIKKIIRSSWKLSEPKQMLKHDQAVSLNWEKLKKGEIHLDPTLHQHLLKFSSREHLQHSIQNYSIKEKKPMFNAGSDFTKIILDYEVQRLKMIEKDKNLETKNQIKSSKTRERDEFSIPPVPSVLRIPANDKMTTLQELRKNLKKHKSPSQYTEYDKAFLKGEETQSNFLTEVDNYELSPNEKELNDNLSPAQSLSPIEDEPIRMHIKIPKDMPRASIYKLKNVYYNADGKFLYRVPGMKKA